MKHVVYLDSSAVVKLVFDEPETAALVRFLRDWPTRVSSTIAELEVIRLARRVSDPVVERHARQVLSGLDLVRLDDRILTSAATLDPRGVRALDAIHLATAMLLATDVAGMVAYNRRLADACGHHGITVWSPG